MPAESKCEGNMTSVNTLGKGYKGHLVYGLKRQNDCNNDINFKHNLRLYGLIVCAWSLGS